MWGCSGDWRGLHPAVLGRCGRQGRCLQDLRRRTCGWLTGTDACAQRGITQAAPRNQKKAGQGGMVMVDEIVLLGTAMGGATPRVWTPTIPTPTNRWPEAPWGGGGGFGLARDPWPHRLKVSEGLRHGSAKKLFPRSYLSPGNCRHIGSAHAAIRSPGFGTLRESIQRSLACASAAQPLDQPFCAGGGGGLGRGGSGWGFGGVREGRGGGGSSWGNLGWGPSVGQSQAPLTSPYPPSNHTITLTRTEYWDQAGGKRNITFKAFCDFRRAKIAYNGLKTGSFHLFVHPKRSSSHYGKTRF